MNGNYFEIDVTVSDFENFVGAACVFAPEGCIDVKEDGLHALSMDPANVALVTAHLHTFERLMHGPDPDAPIRVFVDFEKLLNCVRSYYKKDLLRVTCEGGKLTMKSDGLSYTVALISDVVTTVPRRIPDLKFTAGLSFPADSLIPAIKAASKLYDEKKFGISGPEFSISGDTLTVLAFNEGDAFRVDIDGYTESQGEAKSIYSAEYISHAWRRLGGRDVLFEISTDAPARIQTVDHEPVMISFMIAPRIENK